MTWYEIEQFITWLDEKTRDECMCPDNMTFDCCDCYMCRVHYFETTRQLLRDKGDELSEEKEEDRDERIKKDECIRRRYRLRKCFTVRS